MSVDLIKFLDQVNDNVVARELMLLELFGNSKTYETNLGQRGILDVADTFLRLSMEIWLDSTKGNPLASRVVSWLLWAIVLACRFAQRSWRLL